MNDMKMGARLYFGFGVVTCLMERGKVGYGVVSRHHLGHVFLLVAGLFVTEVAMAGASTVTGNIGVTSDYIFRGISQTSHRPAIQGGLDYVHESGFYAGVYASNVNWISNSGAVASGSANLELDTYLGLKNTFADDFSYDAGFIRYNYPGSYKSTTGFSKADTDEVYGAIGYKWFSAKYSYALGDFLTVPGARGTRYIELNANLPLADTGFIIGLDAGQQIFKPAAASIYTYTDYKLGISKDINGYLLGVAYTQTNAGPAWTYPVGGNWGRGTAALSLIHVF